MKSTKGKPTAVTTAKSSGHQTVKNNKANVKQKIQQPGKGIGKGKQAINDDEDEDDEEDIIDSSDSDNQDDNDDDDDDDEDEEEDPKKMKITKANEKTKSSNTSQSKKSNKSNDDEEENNINSKRPGKRPREDDEDEEEEDDKEDGEEDNDEDSEEEERKEQTKTKKLENDPSCTIFISGIPYTVTEEELKEFCEQLITEKAAKLAKKGKKEALSGVGIVDIRMPRFHDTGKPRGYCHIDFSAAVEASNAVQFLDKAVIKGRYLDVKMALPKDVKQSSVPKTPVEGCKVIFVKNLPYSVEEPEITKHFKGCGSIREVRLGIDNITGRVKGFAYVTFENAMSVKKAVSMNGSMLGGRKIFVDYETGAPRASYKGTKKLKKELIK